MATPAKPQAKRERAPRVTPRNGGRKPWTPTEEQRMIVRFLAGRATQETIASVVGTTVDTLVKHCREEFNEGAAEADLMVEGALFRECMKGNATCIIWWEKTRRRFREVTAHEHSGPNGAPIEHRDMSGYTDDQLALLEQAAKLLGGRDPGSDGES